MKKIYLIAAVLTLFGCANSENDAKNLVTLLSYEKYTDLYMNNELQGINHTQAKLPYKGIKNTILEGRKKGCKTAILHPDYEFDTPMVLNPFNLFYVPEKYFSWDWWRPARRDLYNLTPICEN
ncbi:MAG: hypothetical protein IJ525_03680 [Alphaproteobacteria bacterium]|nr:hypothetical protein [Alphaproteobacteria bacterium]